MSEDDGLPKGAVLIKDILDTMGVRHYEPSVVTQLLEFLYRYMSDVLQDAEAFCSSSSREISREDVMLAVQSEETFQFAQPPTQEVLAALAEQRNRQPLPPLSKRHGLRLPPEEDCLLGANYQLRRSTPGAASEAARPMDMDGRSAQGQSSLRPAIGSAKRPHLDIQLQGAGGGIGSTAAAQAPSSGAQAQGPSGGSSANAPLQSTAPNIEWI